MGALAATSAAPVRAADTERVRLAIFGVRGRGSELASNFTKADGAEIVAVCDIDDAVLARPVKIVESATGKAPRVEKDFRRLLDDKNIDAVLVAAPDHWHALMTVMACQAGKDVYCEKPASHNIVEGRRMIQAARKYDRVVQLGTQRRSAPHIQEAVSLVQEGRIGKVSLAKTWQFRPRPSIGHGQPGEVPKGVDYALWQGPAPDRPFYPNRFHYNWHWFWNWGTAEIGNNGIHAVDVARWGLGVDSPVRVTSGGGKLYFDDDQETPDTQVVTWEFPGCAITWEHMMSSKHDLDGTGFGIEFLGDKGTMLIGSKGWKITDSDKNEERPATEMQVAHAQNFLDCVRSRSKPNAEIEIGHLSTRLCHLGNIAHRVGRKLTFDGQSETFPDDSEANALLSREYSSRFSMPSEV